MARGFIMTSKTQLKLQERVTKIPEVLKAVDALGKLDALLALARFEERLGAQGCHPELREGSPFRASYTGMRNPVVALETGCVPNDIEVGRGKVVILTGPNSGGKSTIATGLLQNQVLAQLGTKVVADQASLTVADQILYQGPIFKALGKHGKFGTEVEATRDIFHRAKPTSLVVLDEVGDGTSTREGARQSLATLWGFNKLRVGTVVVTHNRELAKRLAKRGIGEPFQMGTDGKDPNYQLLPGISPESNAERVAKALRFSPEDIRQFVRERRSLGQERS
jgi:DNA mismatch repair ATPase MutS